jgi:peptide/nickel transport system ATP-binding protein
MQSLLSCAAKTLIYIGIKNTLPLMQPLLQIENLCIDFLSEGKRTEAVKNISFSINNGEILALVGESGSGKSVTALSILQLLPSPPAQYSNGKILFSENENTVDLLRISGKQLQTIRGNRVSMVFQEPMSSLNPVMKCGEQVMEAILQHKNISKAEAKSLATEWLSKVKLPEPGKLFYRYPHQLSGGQKQRVMIAMAMCCEPALLICDEPTTALDVTVQKNILQLIRELVKEKNIGVLFITHDLGVVYEFADRAAIMYRGEIIEQNSVTAIFHQPEQAYTKALLTCRPANHPKEERLPVVEDFLSGNSKEKPTIHSIATQSKTSNVLAEVKNLTVSFPVRKNILGKVLARYTAVDNVSCTIYKGETVGLVGESGCGKTTLGRTLLRLIEPAKGSIIYNTRDITNFNKSQLKEFRKDVQLVFQDPFSSLNPRLTIGEAIEEPQKILLHQSKQERQKTTKDLLEKVNLSPSMMNRYPHEFSGGQRQRIVIARALSLNPGLLVCDESVSALDVSVQAQVLNLLNDLKKEFGLTMLFISHDLSVVRYMCDRIMVMSKGKIVESGTAEEVYDHPKSEYTKQLLSAIPKAG